MEGERVTENARTIGSVPLRLAEMAAVSEVDSRDREKDLRVPFQLAVRGEVIMSVSSFRRLNQSRVEAGLEPYANPRNAAAGALRQLDSRVTSKRRPGILRIRHTRGEGCGL